MEEATEKCDTDTQTARRDSEGKKGLAKERERGEGRRGYEE